MGGDPPKRRPSKDSEPMVEIAVNPTVTNLPKDPKSLSKKASQSCPCRTQPSVLSHRREVACCHKTGATGCCEGKRSGQTAWLVWAATPKASEPCHTPKHPMALRHKSRRCPHLALLSLASAGKTLDQLGRPDVGGSHIVGYSQCIYIYMYVYIYMYIGIDGLIDVRKKNPRIMFERKTGLSPDFPFLPHSCVQKVLDFR